MSRFMRRGAHRLTYGTRRVNLGAVSYSLAFTDSGVLTDTMLSSAPILYNLVFTDSGSLTDDISRVRSIYLSFTDSGELRDTRQVNAPAISKATFDAQVAAAKNGYDYFTAPPWRANYEYFKEHPPWRPKNPEN